MIDYVTARSDAERRHGYLNEWRELEYEYTSWRPVHQKIIDFVQPNRGEFLISQSNRGDNNDTQIVNNTAGDCSQKLGAAMDTGITSEAREWFTLAPENPDVAENDGVREYCHNAQQILFGLIAKSNFYPANRNLLEDLIGPAVGVMMIEEDPITVFRCTHIPIGQYRLAADASGRVNKLVRQWVLTAQQMVDEFGEENVSQACRNAIKNKTTQVKFQVLQIVKERTARQYGKIDARNKPWESIWLEVGIGNWSTAIPNPAESSDPMGPVGLLRESGYDEQPFIAPRWNALGTNAYGKESPGWKGYRDSMQLQAEEIAGAKSIAKILDPPMNQPEDLKNGSLLPGALNPHSSSSRTKFEPSVVIDPETVTVIREERAVMERRLERTFYSDVLFLLSRDQTGPAKTAEEIRGKLSERLLQLGGVFSRYADEALKQAIRRFFNMALRAGRFPPPPKELLDVGGAIKVDFQNPLVTAQKTVAFSAMKELVSFGIAIAQAATAGVDKLDGDECLDSAAEMLGVKPNCLKSDDIVAQERAQKAAQAKAAQMGTAMTQMAPAIKDLSASDPEKLRQLTAQFGPNAQAQATA